MYMSRSGAAALDNPMWNALIGPHRALARGAGGVRWYPHTVAPFIAIESVDTLPDLNAALAQGFSDPAYFTGVLPPSLTDGWRFVSRSNVLQMVPSGDDLPQSRDDDIRVLGGADRHGMLALTRVAFPDYFRERTAELGVYLGVFSGNELVAMAGERLALEGMQEISGVCTHPDHVGRGHARRLTYALMRRHKERGVGSFLHVSEGNLAARRLYESMGFVVRASLPLAKIAQETAF